MKSNLTRRRFLIQTGRCALFCTASAMAPGMLWPGQALAAKPVKGRTKYTLSPYFTPLADNIIRCELCPHHCEVEDGQRGLCGVRENKDGKYYSLVFGNPCAVDVDPIEKKPFYHVLPKTRSFSIATAGCNFDCKFCQNWEISQARPEDTYNYDYTPEQIVQTALSYKCQSIASTYVEPTIFMEYMTEIARATQNRPVLKVMHSNGFVNRIPLSELCDYLDAACIDLKGFTQEYYHDMSAGSLEPVLETLKYLRGRQIHTELVTLVIPGRNDDMAILKNMCQWIKDELGQDTPLHFSRFYPRYKLLSLAPTPLATLEKARAIAMQAGLNYVYIGNIAKHPGNNTYCPNCQKMLIQRIGYSVDVIGLKNGKCKYCQKPIHGIWEMTKG